MTRATRRVERLRILGTVDHSAKGAPVLRHALTHYIQLGSIRNEDWVAAQFGYR